MTVCTMHTMHKEIGTNKRCYVPYTYIDRLSQHNLHLVIFGLTKNYLAISFPL